MWKGVLLTLGLLLLAALGAAALAVFLSLHPEAAQPDLRQEFAVIGVAVGQAGEAEIVARFGPPGRQRSEHAGAVYEYPDRGLLLRTGRPDGRLIWYEFTSPALVTAKGVRIGATLPEVMKAYGSAAETASVAGRIRLRYTYGTAYALEFYFGTGRRVERVVFFKAR